MNYDVFVSYSMSLSSRAYELSAQLSRDNVMCYLDCVESSFTLGDYTRTILEESRVFVLLADKLPASSYATALLQSVTGMVKPMLVCLASDAALPGELRERCTLTTDATLLADIQCLLEEEPEEDADEEELDAACAHATPTTPTFTVTPLYDDYPEEDYDESPYTEGRDEDPVAELDRQRRKAQIEELMREMLPHDDEPEEEDYDDAAADDYVYEGEFEGFEGFGDPEPELPEATDEPDGAEDAEESPLSDLERITKKISDLIDENPKLLGYIVFFLLLLLLEYCS